MTRKLTHEEIVIRQHHRKPGERFPIFGLLNNIRSLYNVGSMFRTSDGAHIERLYLSGITGAPPKNGIKKTALGAEEEVPWEYVDSAEQIIKELKTRGTQIVVLEQTEASIPYYEAPIRFPCCLVVGNEISGVDTAVTDLADFSIEIPMWGIKNSLNVAVAFGIALFDLVKKYEGRLTQAQGLK